MNDERTKQLWKAVDTGIIRIFSSALDMVRVSAEYFGFFLRFTNSFKFFNQCYSDGQDVTLFTSLERLKKDIREFNAFRETFAKTVVELNKTAMECIGNCVEQQIGAKNWETSRQKLGDSETAYWAAQNKYNTKALDLDKELDGFKQDRITQQSNIARTEQEIVMFETRIQQNQEFEKQCKKQLEDLRKMVSEV
eukprot:504851_1